MGLHGVAGSHLDRAPEYEYWRVRTNAVLPTALLQDGLERTDTDRAETNVRLYNNGLPLSPCLEQNLGKLAGTASLHECRSRTLASRTHNSTHPEVMGNILCLPTSVPSQWRVPRTWNTCIEGASKAVRGCG